MKAQALSAIQQEDKGALKTFMGASPEMIKKLFASMEKGAKNIHKEKEFYEGALKSGIAKRDENGNIVANTNAEDWVRGMALASNSTMDRATIGGIRFNNQFNASDGTVATNADASTTDKSGTHIDTSNSTKTGTYAQVPDGFVQRAWEEINEKHPNAPLSEKMQMLSQRMAQFEKAKSYANLKQNAIFELGDFGAGAVAALEGLGIYNAVEGVTKGKIKLNPEKLQKDGAVKYTAEDIENNPELRKQGIREPGFYKDGKRVATLEGFATDPETGRVMEKGIINRTARKAWDKLDDLGKKLSPFKSLKQGAEETVQETTNTANDGSTNNKQTNPKENLHNNPPSNSDTHIVNDGGEKVKGSGFSGFVGDAEKTGGKIFSEIMSGVMDKALWIATPTTLGDGELNDPNLFGKNNMKLFDFINGRKPAPSIEQLNKQLYEAVNTQPVSTAAAQAVTQPSSGADYHTSITNQVEQARATNYIQQAMNNLKDVTHPIAPAPGVTIPTMGGNLSIGTSNNGNLQIGDYETRVPMAEFRNFMNNNPQVYQAFAQTIATSPFNNDNVQEKFGSSYDKRDNGTMENLLSDMNYYARTSTKDSQIGLGGMLDMQERMIEILEEQKEALKPEEDKNIK